MKSETKVLVIGGGITGVSTLYHLAKAGWTDVMLVEKLELTSGSTWHAAGNLPSFSTSLNIMKLQKQSIELYQQLAEQTGESVGHHQTGSIRLAHTQERLDEFKRVVGLAKLAGMVGVEVIGNDRLRELHPYLDTTGLLGGLWDPYDGHIDPTSVTNAMAKLARGYGATIVRHNPVTAIEQLPGNRWQVTTEKGGITADIIVNAAGFRANEVAAMIGHQFPMCSLEHQYLVTDAIPALEQRPGLLPLLRDPDVSYYLRQEGKGLILGPYERNPVAWAVDGVPAQFGQELLQPELGRLEDIIGEAIEQIPLIGLGGIRTVVNGPIVYTPDGLPLLGPVSGYDNYFACAGFSFGITQGGGAGRYLAQWIMQGHPEVDLWELDSRRFGAYANLSYTVDKALPSAEGVEGGGTCRTPGGQTRRLGAGAGAQAENRSGSDLMSVLIVAEHDNTRLKPATLSTLAAAQQLGLPIDLLVAGHACTTVVEQAARLASVNRVKVADAAAYAAQLVENVGALVVELVRQGQYSHVLGAASAAGKNLLPRVAALLDVAQVSDVVAVIAADTFVRPIYAGNALVTVQSLDALKVLSIRSSAFAPSEPGDGSASVEPIDTLIDLGLSRFVSAELKKSEGVDLGTARVVVSGGRGMGSGTNFELLEKVAGKLDAAVGASRAAVDAGFVSNDMQVGQTGKIVAPELYIAVGISGAIQHLAGMKDSKVIVAINQDEEAPIFQVADYGLVANLFDAMPALEAELS